MKSTISSLKKIYYFFLAIIFFSFSTIFADVINIPDKEPPTAKELIFQNRSILSCGPLREATVLTYVDVKTLLVISNFFSKNKIPFTTNWLYLKTPHINLNKISSKVPKDILRILFLCLNWEDTKLGNLYLISDSELSEQVAEIKQSKPWKIYSKDLRNEIEELSDAQLKELVHMVLRADQNEKSQGPLENNPSVKSVVFQWML